MKKILSLSLITLLLTQTNNALAQSGPWTKYDNKMKGEALVRDADGGDLEEIKSIIQGGGDVNWQLEPTGLTPLMAAASSDKIEVVRYLLDHGADLNLKDANGRTALDRAKMFGANDVVKLINQYLQKKQPDPAPDPKPIMIPAKKEAPKPLPLKKADNIKTTAGSLVWPALGTYQPGDSVIFFAASWKRGTIKEVGLPNDPSNKYAKPSEMKYLIAPDASVNWPDWTDWSKVVKSQREPFWTSWFIGDWMTGETMGANTRTDGAYERTVISYGKATDALQISANGTYKWKIKGSKEITGKWSAATDGPGIVLHKGYKNLDWTIRNESSATELNVRGMEKARLYPEGGREMQISAKRQMREKR